MDTDAWKPVAAPGFMEVVGPLLKSRQPNESNTYGLLTDQRHANAIGIVHGGVITTLLDQAIAIVAWNAADRQPTVTVQMDASFLGAAKVGDFLTVRAQVRHATRSLMFLDAEVFSGDAAIARATAIMKVAKMTGTSA
ncbi:PaaI family thioesterase [Paracoccus tibetensis]|uniref:Medium/long-chain acyl-CoA thioesterase YigI n=1 Tax=Paracoccus tibetensis TaxID=336292 RepID=A0A1G5JPG6_9RHOB|nr:PaaI family thioesterase [Paracoccus tibetensis]SCY90285.1 uncharacterized domain 1-containing protein [Paracoccus tibetensis]